MNLNITCPINFLGYGRFSANLLTGLSSSDSTIAWWPIGQTEHTPEELPFLVRFSKNRDDFDPNAPSVRIFHPHDLAHHVGRGMKVGYTLFETDALTDLEKKHLQMQDLVCVPSRWAKEVLEKNGISTRIAVVPCGVNHDVFQPQEYNDKFVIFCTGKWEVRKGHDVLRYAFERAFCEDDDVKIVMHCHNRVVPGGPTQAHLYNQSWENFYRTSSLGSKIEFINHHLPQSEMVRLMQQSTCGVFLSRAEGWNMPLLEMLSCGKHVVATNISAHTEYLNHDNAHLVDVPDMEEARDDVWFHGVGKWGKLGDKEIDQAADYLRGLYDSWRKGNLQMNHWGVHTAKNFTPRNTAWKLFEALK